MLNWAKRFVALMLVLVMAGSVMMPAMAYETNDEKQIKTLSVAGELAFKESRVLNEIKIENKNIHTQQARKLATILHEKSKKAIHESVKRFGNLITTKSTVELGRDAVFYTSDSGDHGSSRWGVAPTWYGSQYYLSLNKVEAATLLGPGGYGSASAWGG